MINLTGEQQRVVDIDEGINLVLAPAGSGKTELLSQRVIQAIASGRNSETMACLTFTIRAGKNMIDRVNKVYPTNNVRIGNIHSICSRLLFTNSLVNSDSQIIDGEDSENIIAEIAHQHGLENVKFVDLLKLATFRKRMELDFPNSHLDLLNDASGLMIINNQHYITVAEEYNREKEINNYLDYDDILTYTYDWIRHTDDARQFDWIQIDEVQDLTPIQFDIIEGLTLANAVQVYFGDYNQAIYGFMGARFSSINELALKAGKENIFYLSTNFRSPSYLLDLYNDYSKANLNIDFPKDAVSAINENKPKNSMDVYYCSYYNQDSVIVDGLVNHCLQKQDSNNIAILLRSNRRAEDIARKLSTDNVSHFKMSGFDLFRRATMKSMMAYLTLINSKFNRVAWTRMLYAFDIFETLGESRRFVSSAYKSGVILNDFVLNESETELARFKILSHSCDVVVFDTETTGLDTSSEDVIQIAAVKLRDGEVIDEFDIYINTDLDVSRSQEVHHISKSKLDDVGISHEEGILKFIDFCGNQSILVAHNLKYDFDILTSNFTKYVSKETTFEEVLGGRSLFFDSLSLSKIVYPGLKAYRLEYLIEYLGLTGINSHNALDDTRATAQLALRLLNDCNDAIETQSLFINENMNKIQQVKHKLSPLFLSAMQSANTKVSLTSFIDKYIEFLYNKNNDKAERGRISDDLMEMQKLFNHLRVNVDNEMNKNMTLNEKITKYLPVYNQYSEGDLYIGDEKVFVSTIHKAKGLEFDTVIIPDLDKFPFKYANEEGIDEDARLLYVAITRAKRCLYLTSSGESSIFINRVSKHFNQYNYSQWHK